MPLIEVSMLKGRTIDQKRRLIKEMSSLASDILEVPSERVRIIIREVSPEHWGIGGISKADNSQVNKRSDEE